MRDLACDENKYEMLRTANFKFMYVCSDTYSPEYIASTSQTKHPRETFFSSLSERNCNLELAPTIIAVHALEPFSHKISIV